jgi:hypothetical protein
LREARAYNHSIYLMAGMPYLLLGVFGYLIYRAFRQKALAEQQALAEQGSPPKPNGETPGIWQGSHAATLPESLPCPPPSVGEAS